MLVGCVSASERSSEFCIVRQLEFVESTNTQPILNEAECPLLWLTSKLIAVKPTDILKPISIVHECTSLCSVKEDVVSRRLERELTTQQLLTFRHNFSNNMFSFNIFCINNY